MSIWESIELAVALGFDIDYKAMVEEAMLEEYYEREEEEEDDL